jgi:hypothetical protein
VLYLHDSSPDASPRAISGRTSYLQVRLAFHLYPQLITQLCNVEAFGLPRGFTPASSWPWVAHLVSCLLPATTDPHGPTPSSDSLSLRLRVYSPLTSPQKVTRWLILQKARGQKAVALLPLLVSTRFQVLFHSARRGSFHLSLTVLVHYRSLKVFSLGEWTPQLPTGLACPVVLKILPGVLMLFAYGTLTLSGRPFQCRLAKLSSYHPSDATPTGLHVIGLGSFPFARHYSGNPFFSWRY